DQMSAIKQGLKDFRGIDSADALELAIIPFGGKLTNATLANETGQLLAMREFSVEDVARITGVSPHRLFALADKGAQKAIEQLGEEVVKYSLGPWIANAEQELTQKLLTEDEIAQGFYIRY